MDGRQPLGRMVDRRRGRAHRVPPAGPARVVHHGFHRRRRRRDVGPASPPADGPVSPAAVPVGPLGLGAAQAGNLGRPVSDQDFDEAFATMWAGGVRYLDTAPHYGLGLSERRCAGPGDRPRDECSSPRRSAGCSTPPERADEPDDEGFAVPATHRRRFDFSRDGILRSSRRASTGSGSIGSTWSTCTTPTTTGTRRHRGVPALAGCATRAWSALSASA